MENILLVEPDYNNKYPPIGLMKIATYHKNKGDYVEFYKGKAPFTQISRMDRIYITSLFTFHFDITVDTVNHYLKYKSVDNVYLVPPEKVGVKREKYINEKGFPYLMSNL